MLNQEISATDFCGAYRDVVRGADGAVSRDGGWHKSVIVLNCRRLLAALLRGQAGAAQGIQPLWNGAGDPAWDTKPRPPLDSDTGLFDKNHFTVPAAALRFDYLDPKTGAVATTPTRRLQIVATLGPRTPKWPDLDHPTSTLREFGLVGQLSGAAVLVNEVRHAALTKGPTDTQARTIQLVL